MEDLHEKQKRILAAVDECGGTANTSEIREVTGIPAATVGYHTDVLHGQGFIQQAGKVDVGAPSRANLYRLTPKGRDAAHQLDLTLDDRALEEQVSDLTRRMDELTHRVDELAEEQESLSKRLGGLIDVVEDELS